jgi:hypothetical protein
MVIETLKRRSEKDVKRFDYCILREELVLNISELER